MAIHFTDPFTKIYHNMVRTCTHAACFILLIGWLAAGCTGSKSTKDETNGLWMKTDPVQCLQNPWEEAWLESNNKDYQAYPKGHPRKIEPEEARIIRQFFEDQGVTVLAMEAESFGEDVMVCEACSCPQGYTLYIKVKGADEEKMKSFQFIKTVNYPKDEK